ncbi:MAG: peptidoglycan DD-metalloendopeptidase family protein [Thermoleophilaceae bacterium]
MATPSGAALAADSTDGGADYTAVPVISGVKCASQCSGKTRVRAGGVVRVEGRNLRDVRNVIFHGSQQTKGDNVKVRVSPSETRSFRVKVPLSAASGPLTAWKSSTVGSDPSDSISVLPPPPPEGNAELSPATGPRDPGAPRLDTGISTGKAFFAGSKVKFSYRVSDSEPTPVTVELVRAEDGVVVRTWKPGAVEPNTVHTIRWSGKAAPGTKASQGRYVFRVTAQNSAGAYARSSSDTEAQRDAFDFYGHIFPIRGQHNYGQSGARFGSGRSGHSHQGQDVFARCGTKLVAARAGRVQFNQYHSAAGYYLVIDGYESKNDYVYMHLQERSPFQAGDRVKTGQMIGRVGDTGNAQGCHLHYEMWDSPGWYDGGNPFDPYRFLRTWDGWS